MEFYFKHFIRLDTNDVLIKGFSTAFEKPTSDDICINIEGGRHFELDGVENPSLFNMNYQPIYKFLNGAIVKLSDEERNTLYPIPDQEPSEIEKLKAENDQLKSQITSQQLALDVIMQELLPSILEMLG